MRQICILGSAGPTNRWANDLEPHIELWAMNLCHAFLTRPAQRWFQLHHRMHNRDNGHPPGHFGRPLGHEEFLAGLDIPVYMREEDALIPSSVEYPLSEVMERFGAYFTSTMAYMIALALYEGVDEISLLGIDLDVGDEYKHQKPCVEYLLGMAKGMGVKVTLPVGGTLLKAPLYAYGEFPEVMGGLRLESVEVVAGG